MPEELIPPTEESIESPPEAAPKPTRRVTKKRPARRKKKTVESAITPAPQSGDTEPAEEDQTEDPATTVENKGKRLFHSRASQPITVSAENEAKIKETLNTIYQDDTGSMPDMKAMRIKKSNTILKFFSTLLILGALGAAAIWLGLFYLPNRDKTATAVTLTLSGPTEITQGVTTTYTLTYKNNTGDSIENATVNIYYPAGFVFSQSSQAPRNTGDNEWVISSLAPREEKSFTITGASFATINTKQSWRAFFNYRTKNVNSELQQLATLETTIVKSPYTISIMGPDKVVTGNEVEYTFQVKNDGGTWVKDMYVVPRLPDGFSITTTSQPLDKSRRWTIKTTATTTTPPTALPIKVRGIFASSTAENPTLGAALALLLPGGNKTSELVSSELKLSLAKSELSLLVAINGSVGDSVVAPGGELNVTVRLKNASASDIKNVTIRLVFDAPSVTRQSLLKWTELEDENKGDVRGEQITESLRRGIITWNSQLIPALAKIKPNGEALIDIRLPIKNADEFELGAVKDPTALVIASATYTDRNNTSQTLTANPITLTFNSDTTFEARDIVNGSEHDISWVINNTFHPLKNIEISATAFGDINWVATDKPTAGDLTYNEKDKKIIWKIATMPESVDVLTAPFTITLNKDNPTQNTLVSKVHVIAEDTITGKIIDFYGNEIILNR